MTDLVRKLRNEWPVGPGNRVACQIMDEAADRIEALEAEVKRLKDTAAFWEGCAALNERHLNAMTANAEALADAYSELKATVQGECPSLLDEDSGASQVLLDLVLAADAAHAKLMEGK